MVRMYLRVRDLLEWYLYYLFRMSLFRWSNWLCGKFKFIFVFEWLGWWIVCFCMGKVGWKAFWIRISGDLFVWEVKPCLSLFVLKSVDFLNNPILVYSDTFSFLAINPIEQICSAMLLRSIFRVKWPGTILLFLHQGWGNVKDIFRLDAKFLVALADKV